MTLCAICLVPDLSENLFGLGFCHVHAVRIWRGRIPNLIWVVQISISKDHDIFETSEHSCAHAFGYKAWGTIGNS